MSWLDRLRRKKIDKAPAASDAAASPAPAPEQPKPKRSTACPKCGFSYGWDGKNCNHCNPGSSSKKPHKAPLKPPADRYAAASARVLAELQGGAASAKATDYSQSILRYRMQAALEINRLGLTGERATAHYAETITTLLAKEHGLTMDEASRIFMDSLK